MTPLFATIDPWILAFSAVTVVVTIWMGFRSARTSKTASDFFVAGRSVSVGWNASAISGEYLSAASFMGVAGMVMSSGYDALWYPVCYACGYLFLLLFIAGPLRRFGAYTIPDFAEGRFDSPLFRKIAVVFVLFIGFFYTMPQMKGAGTTLAYIFPGLPYWAGVVLVGAVITLNVALGGMKGITLVQAFQYWAKMFAISVPIFVLMAVYGHYGSQLGANERDLSTSATQQSGQVRQQHPPIVPPYQNASATNYLPSIGSGTWPLQNGFVSVDGKLPEERNFSPAQKAVDFVRQTASGILNSNAPTLSVRGILDVAFAVTKISGGHVWIHTNAWLDPVTDKSRQLALPFIVNLSHDEGADFARVQAHLSSNSLSLVEWDNGHLLLKVEDVALLSHPKIRRALPEKAPADATWINPFGPLTTKAAKAAKLSAEESKPYSLLYTYSLIIALVCGTAGLPHILVRFYTNPDGVAAKRTTMWVMILIGVFYVFPPVFGVMGRNLLPSLYEGVGAKGTDKVVLELPRILNEEKVGKWESEKVGEDTNTAAHSPAHSPTFPPAASLQPKRTKIPWGSILSGITCAGAFAAFMSTFSGLLVSMTGAMAHDVYGRMLNPKATPEQRLRAFKIAAVGIGGVAIVLGMQVEPLQINFMVGQAFAIAAASYFPLLFVSVWWRKLTMKGAATGMLTGGTLALAGISLTSFSDLKWLPLDAFWAMHPLLRILCEQPAIWAVPLAIALMVVVSKLTQKDVPADIRMKMLVLHAPEKLGLKQEYIQEHQTGH
jgi:probable sodium:solute symporter